MSLAYGLIALVSLCIQEMMKMLNLVGIHSDSSVSFDRDLPAEVAMRLFDFYEYVVENAFDGLSSLLARFFCRDGCFYACVDAVCSLDLTALQTDAVSVSVPEENCYALSFRLEGGDRKNDLVLSGKLCVADRAAGDQPAYGDFPWRVCRSFLSPQMQADKAAGHRRFTPFECDTLCSDAA